MNCRTFHQKLEDYLEDGLDFSGRFGMERHAQQCIGCGKVLTDAQQIRQMASELQRVKAPVNFESSILREIAARKAHNRFWGIRRFWIYGFEWPSWRKMAFASSCLAIFGFAIFYMSHRAALDHASTHARAVAERANVAIEVKEAKNNPGTGADLLSSGKQATVEMPAPAKKPQPSRKAINREPRIEKDTPDMDYAEYMIMGPDNRAVPVRLPKRIPMRYSQMSEEYFIQNVSH